MPSTAARRLVAALVVTGLLLTAGCSEGDDEGSGSPSSAPPTTADTDEVGGTGDGTDQPAVVDPSELPEPEVFTGDDADFYVVPDPLPSGQPGQLIRVQERGVDDGIADWRVMYHSVDSTGADRAVTGIVSHPTEAAPADGWPVVAWAHGTTGIAAECAPSRVDTTAPAFGLDAVRVATDYIGLGPVGEVHSYLNGVSEGHSVIDSVRAARQLADSGAGTRWVAAGHSQGGHAALFTNELAESYAPELDLLGTAAIAPAAEVGEVFGERDTVVPRMVGLLALYGAPYETPEIDPRHYVGDDVAADDALMTGACMDEIVPTMVSKPWDTFYENDPLTTEPARSYFLANDPGQVAVESPLLVVYGTADWWVVPARVDSLHEQLCEVGQVHDVVAVEGADHDTVVPMGLDSITAWFEDRLAGEPAPDACPA